MLITAAIGMGLLGGCAGRPSLLPNSDPNLRRTSAQFAADAAKRHPFKADAPSGGDALANAQYDLTFATVQILNYSDDDWNDVEVWVNKKYVVFIPLIEKGKSLVKTIPFQMLYDDSGNYFWTDGGKNPIQTVDIYRNGKMYSVPVKMAD
jgi:hypothetical protein